MKNSIWQEILVFVVAYFCFNVAVYSQNNYKHYTTSDGLPHDVVYNIIQDSKGLIWICTDDGLSKFDGETFLNYNSNNGLLSNFVTDITEISDDRFAISTWGKGLHYLKNDTIFKPEKFNDIDKKIYSVLKKDNALFSMSSFQIYKYNTKQNQSKQKKVTKNGALVNYNSFDDSNGAFAAFSKCNNSIFYHDAIINNRNLKGVYELNDSFESSPRFQYLNTKTIHSLVNHFEDNFIFGSNNRLIFGSENTYFKDYEIPEIAKENSIEKIIVAPNNFDELILVVSNPQGLKRLYTFNVVTKTVVDLIDELSINTTISDVLFDFEGNLWITTFGNGIYCYYYSKPKIKNVLLGNFIVDIVNKNNKIYALSASSLFVLDPNGSVLETYKTKGFGRQLLVYKDVVYVVALNSKNENFKNFKTLSARYADYYESGKIFQDDSTGFIQLNSNTIYKNTDLELKSVNYNDEFELFTNKGKWNYNLTNSNFYKDSIFNNSLTTTSINHAFFKNDVYYLSTSQGFLIKDKSQLEVFTEKEGLISNTINFSTQIKDDLYLASQKGLSIISDDHIYNYTKSSGVSSLSIHKITLVDHNLWVAGDNGISILKLNSIEPEHPPRIEVSNKNNILNYKLISYEGKAALKLMYTINNKDWIELKALNGSIDFNNLKPNDYKPQFKARKNNSNWVFSDVLNINIETPWYSKWWNISVLAILLIAILTTAFLAILNRKQRRNKILENAINQKIKAEKELNKVRENIAKDFHDDLGNKLASISLLSERLAKISTDKNIELANKINEDSKYLYKGTKDFIFSLKEQSDYLEEIIVYLSDFCQEYCSQFGLDVEINDETNNNIKLPFYWSKQIVFIFKEAITNVVKHANANKVTMNFKFIGKKLHINLEDNGKGLVQKETLKQSTSGIANMQKRALSIGCKLNIESEKSVKGCNVIFIGEPPV